MKKASDAAEFGIDEATRQLCYDAVKSGEWNQVLPNSNHSLTITFL
jgi:hypothetical protein